jgi:protein O-mannosyl-transferase
MSGQPTAKPLPRSRRPARQARRRPTVASQATIRPPWAGWRPLGYGALLVILGVVGYANSFRVPFTLDDEPSILWNPVIKAPVSIVKLLQSDRPVVNLSFALNYAVGATRVFGYHAFNLVAHLCCGLLFFGFARYTLRLATLRPQFDRAADGLAAVATAIFLVHPIQTESVTYIVQRAEIFASMALIAGLWLAALAAHSPRPFLYFPAIVAVAVLGFWSKDTVVVLPILIALYGWAFIPRDHLRALLRYWPLYALLLLAMAGAVGWRWWQATHVGRGVAVGGVDLAGLDLKAAFPDTTPHEIITPWGYLRGQFGVWLYYLRLIVVPDRLCFDCGYRGAWPVRSSLLGDMVWVPAAVLAALALAAWRLRRRAPLVFFCSFASAIVLVPTSSILPLTDAYFEHRLYLPIAFLALLVVTTAFSACEALVRRGWLTREAARIARVAAAGALVATLVPLTLARNSVYADPLRLSLDTVAKAPRSARARYNLANDYARRGQPEKAVEQYRAVIAMDPGPWPYYMNLGRQYVKLNRHQEAIDALERARDGAPPNAAIVYRNLAVAYSHAGRVADAIVAAERACEIQPLHAGGHKVLAAVYAQARRTDDALQQYQWVLSLTPNDAQAHQAIAKLTRRTGTASAPTSPHGP